MRLKRHITIGLAIIVVGFVPFLYTNYRYYSHNWTPLTFPVTLQRGVIRSPNFQTDLNGTYVVWLAFDHMSNVDRQDCLLGLDFPRGSCSAIQQILHLNLSVYRGNSEILKDSPYQPNLEASSVGKLEVALGTFEGKRGTSQQIRLTILNDPRELNLAHPRIIVEAHNSYWEKWIILGQLALIAALLPALIGLGWITWSLVLWWKSKPSIKPTS